MTSSWENLPLQMLPPETMKKEATPILRGAGKAEEAPVNVVRTVAQDNAKEGQWRPCDKDRRRFERAPKHDESPEHCAVLHFLPVALEEDLEQVGHDQSEHRHLHSLAHREEEGEGEVRELRFRELGEAPQRDRRRAVVSLLVIDRGGSRRVLLLRRVAGGGSFGLGGGGGGGSEAAADGVGGGSCGEEGAVALRQLRIGGDRFLLLGRGRRSHGVVLVLRRSVAHSRGLVCVGVVCRPARKPCLVCQRQRRLRVLRRGQSCRRAARQLRYASLQAQQGRVGAVGGDQLVVASLR